jgi:hypothetical protein
MAIDFHAHFIAPKLVKMLKERKYNSRITYNTDEYSVTAKTYMLISLH